MNNFPYKIPSKYDNLPRLLGRANVEIKTSKGNMGAIIDGYNAPLTAGAFITGAAIGTVLNKEKIINKIKKVQLKKNHSASTK